VYDAVVRPGLQRARGALAIAWKQREARTVLARLRQEGCLKARFPRPLCEGVAEAVLLNVSGGIAAGDVLSARMEAQAGTFVTVAAQAAERLYRALQGSDPAQVRNRVSVASGARLEWLPQETILFDGCALDRALDVEMAEDATVLCVESLVFGRAAMGEQVERASVRDVIRLRRGSRLVLHDAVRLHGDARRVLDRPAAGGGARAVATIVYAALDAGSRLDPLRAALAAAPAQYGASTWDGMLVARIVAKDGACLRAATVAGLAALRGARPLPRVWMC
jgi:urease accessory protein